MSSELSTKEKLEEKLSEYVKTKKGRSALTLTMQGALRTERDYFSISRKVLHVDDLEDGEFPIYPKKENDRVFFIDEEGIIGIKLV